MPPLLPTRESEHFIHLRETLVIEAPVGIEQGNRYLPCRMHVLDLQLAVAHEKKPVGPGLSPSRRREQEQRQQNRQDLMQTEFVSHIKHHDG